MIRRGVGSSAHPAGWNKFFRGEFENEKQVHPNPRMARIQNETRQKKF
jgi:hypothetical protein